MPNLYVTETGAILEKEAGRLLVSRNDEVLLSVPATRVESVVLVGSVGVTTPALHFLLEREIGLVFLSSHGAFRGRLSGPESRNVGLRQQQYRRAQDQTLCLQLARAIVRGKLLNCRTLALRMRTRKPDAATAAACDDIQAAIGRLTWARTLKGVLGIEGHGSRRYFDVLRAHLHPEWQFPRRVRRPPPDPVNALLSLLYTLLHESCYAALEAVDLDPCCGVLHQPRAGRASLALDLMEEFRPLIADSVARTLLNKRMLTQRDFELAQEGGTYLTRAGWKVTVAQYDQRLQTRVRPNGAERRVTYQRLLEVQARKLRRALTGEAETYEPFLVK